MHMSLNIQGTVIRRSNGSLTIVPTAGTAVTSVEIAESALGSKGLPQMGDTVTVSIAITETASARAEAERAKAPAASHAAETGTEPMAIRGKP